MPETVPNSLTNLADRKVGLLLLNGQHISVSAKDFLRLLFTGRGALFYLIAYVFMVFAYQIETISGTAPPWWAKLVGFGIIFVSYPLFLAIVLCSSVPIAARLKGVNIFEPILSLFVAFLLQCVDSFVVPLILGDVWLQEPLFAHQMVNILILMLILDALFCFFVLPQILASGEWSTDTSVFEDGFADPLFAPKITTSADQAYLGSQAPPTIDSLPDPATKEETVDLDGKEMPLSHVLAVETDDHYVRVWTQELELYFRQSFSVLTTRLGTTAGFIPRRGIWVSFSNIKSICKDDRGKYVVTPLKGPICVVPKAKSSGVRRILKSPPPGMSFDTQGNALRS
jgi:hypothetical protein